MTLSVQVRQANHGKYEKPAKDHCVDHRTDDVAPDGNGAIRAFMSPLLLVELFCWAPTESRSNRGWLVHR